MLAEVSALAGMMPVVCVLALTGMRAIVWTQVLHMVTSHETKHSWSMRQWQIAFGVAMKLIPGLDLSTAAPTGADWDRVMCVLWLRQLCTHAHANTCT